MKKLLYQILLSSLLIVGFSSLSYAGWPFSVAHQINDTSISQMLQPIMPAVVNVSVQGDIPLNQLPPLYQAVLIHVILKAWARVSL